MISWSVTRRCRVREDGKFTWWTHFSLSSEQKGGAKEKKIMSIKYLMWIISMVFRDSEKDFFFYFPRLKHDLEELSSTDTSSDTETQGITNIDFFFKKRIVEEGLKSKQQFFTVEEIRILMIIREEKRISNSEEHKLGIRNTTASSFAVWKQTNREKPVFMHCRVFCREDWRPFWFSGEKAFF